MCDKAQKDRPYKQPARLAVSLFCRNLAAENKKQRIIMEQKGIYTKALRHGTQMHKMIMQFEGIKLGRMEED